MRTEVRSFTIEEVDRLIKAGGNYRRLSEDHARTLLADMKAGRWVQPHPSPIVLHGQALIDGQHRLWAAAEYEKATRRRIKFMVVHVTGDAEAITLSTDTGKKRTIKDHLRRLGVENASTVAAALLIAANCRENIVASAFDNVRGVSNALMADTYDADRARISEAVSLAVSACGKMQAGSPGLLAGVAYLIGKKNRNGCRAFFSRLGDGADLESGNPILRLRAYWQSHKASGTRRAVVRRAIHAAITIKAWNAWATGQRPSILKWATNGAVPETFPVIEAGDKTLFAEGA
jgi:hypothetical protein